MVTGEGYNMGIKEEEILGKALEK